MIDFDAKFPRYDYPSMVPIWCLTPGTDNTIHRFFDTKPLSPSGRYLAVFQLPDRDDFPRPGDRGNIVLVDLETGEEKTIWQTAGWEFQLGANINWGCTDHELYFNDVDTSTWDAFAIKLDPLTGSYRKLGNTIYHISPDGKYIISSNLKSTRRTQGGYGVVVPDDKVPYYRGTTDEDGVWITDTDSGETKLLISTREAAERTLTAERRSEYEKSELYGFHTKWSPDGKKLMFSLRFFPDSKGKIFRAMVHDFEALRYDVFAMTPDKKELYLSIPATEWDKNGHHTNWKNDSSGFTMNLNIHRKGMRFCQVNIDGSGLGTIGSYIGSGHPSIHINGRWCTTDCYLHEPFTAGDNSSPIRIFDLKNDTEDILTRIQIKTQGMGDFRLDPHPVWCDNYNLLIFNAIWRGSRRVFAADMRRFQQA